MPDTLEFAPEELLATHDVEEPLIAGGVRCHGGFLHDGTYVSPRTKFRGPALKGWQEQLRVKFGTEILNAPVATWPGNYPNVAQARFLLQNGIREPIIATLTRIGTVEGFGATRTDHASRKIRSTRASDAGGGFSLMMLR